MAPILYLRNITFAFTFFITTTIKDSQASTNQSQTETQTISKSKSVRHTGLFMAKFLVKKVKRFISELPSRDHERNVIEFDEDVVEETKIPKDVKKGHFAVIAVKGGESKRFILELSYLRNSKFLRLLEKAKEEYGFQQMGALTVPCQPEELQMILEDKI